MHDFSPLAYWQRRDDEGQEPEIRPTSALGIGRALRGAAVVFREPADREE
jgi:hypothetical protein